MVPQKGSKQQKTAKDKRTSYVESREDPSRAEVCRQQHTWALRLELDGTGIPWDTSIQEFQRGHSTYIIEALEQHLLLPKTMEALRRMRQPDLFMSLKRDLAMVSSPSNPLDKCKVAPFQSFLLFTWDSFVVFVQVTQQVFVIEEWVRDAHNKARVEAHSRTEAEKSLGALKQENQELTSQLTAEERARRSAEAKLKSA